MSWARKVAWRDASTRCRIAFKLTGRRDQPSRPGEDQQVSHDLRRTIGLAINRLHFQPELPRKGAGRAQQFEMSEHALQRIVEFVGDAGDELAERGELLRLHQPFSELFPFGLEARLRRQIARDQHVADALPFRVDADR